MFPSPAAARRHRAALDVPAWSLTNNSHAKGALAEQTRSWRHNQGQGQRQAWSHAPSRGMDWEFLGISGRWICFKPSQGRRALPGLYAQVLLVVSECSTTKTCSNLEIFQLLFTDSGEPRGQRSQCACSSPIPMKGYSIYSVNKLFTVIC